ncbi:MAG: hypothetical protein DRG24_01890 [Epsilonproteobacteria bacterium]|nr:MAG: hypothetical protein DRG24_01890 [Campylobacterota bacterium]
MMKRNRLFIIAFIILSALSYAVLTYEKSTKIKEHFQTKTTQYLQNYKTQYEDQKKLSNIIFRTMIDTETVEEIFKDASTSTAAQKDLIRDILYLHLEETYILLHEYNIKQLHFHLPNNESFLRFHRPKKYGDNLSDIRETVKYVNTLKEPVHGFEEGRIYNGYRHVFPLFYQQKHIGSVEVSFSTQALIAEFMMHYDVIANFLVFKDKVDQKVFESEKSNYVPSPFQDFYMEKKIAGKIKEIKKFKKNKLKEMLSQNTKNVVSVKGLDSESFSIYDDQIKEIITFIKVQNPITHKIVGIFVVRSSAEYIFEINKIFYLSLVLIVLFWAVALSLIYKEMLYRDNSRKYRKTLQDKIEEEVAKNREKDKHLLHQSRLAQMGEMISMIAHQWRQPLSAISATSSMIELKAKLNKLENSVAEKKAKEISTYAQDLSYTIDDFRDFFQPNKEKKETTYDAVVESVLGIIKTSLINKNIQLHQELNCHSTFSTYPNELKQVVLNLIKNSEDVLLEEKTKEPYIKIVTYKGKDDYILEISDNGGGVPTEMIEKIFDPYFSTKSEKNGTGLGLYMSKMIIEEHCGGKLTVKNGREGAVFRIVLVNIEDK